MNRRDFAKTVVTAFTAGVRTRPKTNASQTQERFDVRDFGATGDGTTDDGAAFEKALARAARSGGIVAVPKGTFVVRRMLRLTTGVSIEGVANASVIEHIDGTPIVLLCATAHKVGVRDLEIRGRFSFGLVIDRSTDVVVKKCVISGGTTQWSPTAFCGGILSIYSSDVSLEDNTLTRNGLVRKGVLSSDIQVNGFGANVSSHGIHIRGNRCSSISTQYCIGAYDMQRSEIEGNICSGAKTGANNNNGYGILIYETPSSPGSCLENTVANNRVSDVEGSGIYLVKSDHSRVLNNSLDRVANVQADHTLPVAGIALNQSQYVLIRDNEILSAGRAGISVASNRPGVGHVDVANNTISHCRGIGIHLRGLLTDVHVSYNTVTDTSGGIGGDTPEPQDQIVIEQNTVSRTTGSSPGIILSNAALSAVRNNRISDSGGYGLVVSLRDAKSEVNGNIVAGSGHGSVGKYQDIRVVHLKEAERTEPRKP